MTCSMPAATWTGEQNCREQIVPPICSEEGHSGPCDFMLQKSNSENGNCSTSDLMVSTTDSGKQSVKREKWRARARNRARIQAGSTGSLAMCEEDPQQQPTTGEAASVSVSPLPAWKARKRTPSRKLVRILTDLASENDRGDNGVQPCPEDTTEQSNPSPVQLPSSPDHEQPPPSSSPKRWPFTSPRPESIDSIPWHLPPIEGVNATKQKQRMKMLRRLQLKVSKRFEKWAHMAKLIQEEKDIGDDQPRQLKLVISDVQRDTIVEKMVQCCGDDPEQRATFLGSVKKIVECGILQASTYHPMAQGPCEAPEAVADAWTKILECPAEEATDVNLDLLRAADTLHMHGSNILQKWSTFEQPLCRVGQRSDGAWEVEMPKRPFKD